MFLIFELISFRTWSKTSVDFPLKNICDPKNLCGPTFNDSISVLPIWNGISVGVPLQIDKLRHLTGFRDRPMD